MDVHVNCMCGEINTQIHIEEPPGLIVFDGTTQPEHALIQCSLVDERQVHAFPAVRFSMHERELTATILPTSES